MDRFVMRHPDVAVPGVVPASSVPWHEALGWVKVSDAIPEHEVDQIALDDFPAAEPDPEPAQPVSQPALAEPSEELS